MNKATIATIIILIVLGAMMFSLFQFKKTTQLDQPINPENLKLSPVRHESLSPDLVLRVDKFSAVFSEVYPISKEEWLIGFRRDLNPEQEIVIWEHISKAYSDFIESENFSKDQKSEAFGLLLVRSSNNNETENFSNFNSLSIEQARKLLDGYQYEAKAVTVSE